MNAYWMNELVYEGVACPVWLAWVLGGLIAGLVITMVVTIILMNK